MNKIMKTVFYFCFVAITANCLKLNRLNYIKAAKTTQQLKKFNVAKWFTATSFLGLVLSQAPYETLAAPLQYDPVAVVANIDRVTRSLDYITQDIEKKGDAKAIVSQIKFMLSNYKLRENIQTSLSFVPAGKKESAKSHGLTAIEDLALIYEYYSDDVDNMSGNRSPPREVLQLAQDAVKAAKKELLLLIDSYPEDIKTEALEKVAAEFAS